MIRIASGAGFWGDYSDATGWLLAADEPAFGYLQLKYLAEVTMGLLARIRNSGREGYATDFVEFVLDEYLLELLDREITVVTNAGGIAPEACATRMREMATERGRDPTVAAVSGDNITSAVTNVADSDRLKHIETGERLPSDTEPLAAVAYTGAAPIRDALADGADIVITGRVADPALTLGPLLHEFDWTLNHYDRLAADTVAGHLIECGTQVAGGNFLGDWGDISFDDIGYPIAEVAEDGSMTITKPTDTSGTITPETVTEQLVYEIGDPTAYLTPDVIADFTSIQLREAGTDRVQLSGIAGEEPPPQYKTTIHHRHGYKLSGQLLYSRPDALAKARRAAAILENRIEALGLTIAEIHIDYIGHNGTHSPMASEREEYNEIMLRMAARGPSEADLRRLGIEFAPLSMTGPPAVTGLTDGGRPPPQPIVDTWSTLVPRDWVDPEVAVYE